MPSGFLNRQASLTIDHNVNPKNWDLITDYFLLLETYFQSLHHEFIDPEADWCDIKRAKYLVSYNIGCRDCSGLGMDRSITRAQK